MLCISPLLQPTLRREGDARLTNASSKKGNRCGVTTNIYSRKTSEKPEKAQSTNFKCERFRSCIYARGRYQHPTYPSQGTTTFNQVCKYDFNLFYVPFYIFMSFYTFYIFYLFVVDKGVSLAPTYSSIVIRKSDLRSSLKIERWLNYFYPFFARYILIE